MRVSVETAPHCATWSPGETIFAMMTVGGVDGRGRGFGGAAAAAMMIRLEAGGVVARVAAEADEVTLARLIRALRAA